MLSNDLFRRLLTAGRDRGLPLLGALDPNRLNRLDKEQARLFAREVAAVQDSFREPEIESVAAVALWCAHASRTSWLTIQARPAPDDVTSEAGLR